MVSFSGPRLESGLNRVLERICDFYLCPFVCEVGDFDLFRFKDDSPRFIAMYELRVTQAVEQVFDRAGEIVWIEGSNTIACKADFSAWKAFSFSLYCSVQCWRLVMFRLGVRYGTMSFKVCIVLLCPAWHGSFRL